MNKHKWWKLSFSISGFFLASIIFMWAYTNGRDDLNTQQLTENKEVAQLLKKDFPNLSANQIPTGIFLQSLKFASSSEVNLTGYIWQTYPISKHQDISDKDLKPGFIFPEVIDSGSNSSPTLAYREQIDNGQKEVIGWYFEATLKQKFVYSKYPFDHKKVWIRLWSDDFNQETILTPNLSSYGATELDDKYGFDKDIVLGPWDIIDTFFDYPKKQDYNSNFGIRGNIRDEDYDPQYPELYFNIVLKRRFLNSFVVYFIPLSIITCLTFATLMMITEDPEQTSRYGINTSGVISVCSGLFFVVLLSQVQIREQFAGSRIVYVEYLYPLMYVTLLGVSANSYFFSRNSPQQNALTRLINYEDNMVPKLMYWPVLLGSASLITAMVLLPKDEAKSSQKDKLTFLELNKSSKAALVSLPEGHSSECQPDFACQLTAAEHSNSSLFGSLSLNMENDSMEGGVSLLPSESDQPDFKFGSFAPRNCSDSDEV